MSTLKRQIWKALIYYGMLKTGLWGLRLVGNTLAKTIKALQSHKTLYASKITPSYAVITGGSGGLGFTFAQQLTAKGFNIILIARDSTKLETCAASLKEIYKVDVKCITFDFAEAGDSVAWIKLAEELKNLDIAFLVNNLGAYSWAPFDKQEEKDIETLINNCVYANTFMTRLVIPHMLSRPSRSAVINVGSFTGEILIPTTAVNCGAKRYIHRLTLALARDYEKTKIDFLCVIPGFIDTPGLRAWKAGAPLFATSTEEVVRRALSQVKSARQRNNQVDGSWNHTVFRHLLTNPFTRSYYVKKLFNLEV